MHRANLLAQFTAAFAFAAVAVAGTAQAAAVHHASTCGEYKYLHNGHCVDARGNPGKPWMAGVYQ